MSEPIRPQFGEYQPRKGYGLRLRDVRDHDSLEFIAIFTAGMLLLCGFGALMLGAWDLAEALGTVSLWVFLTVTLRMVWQFVRGV